MGGLGVIVEYSNFSQEQHENDKLSCSGIYLSNGWILTHGTIVIDILKNESAGPLLRELRSKNYSFNDMQSPLSHLLENSTFKVMLDEKNNRNVINSPFPPSNLTEPLLDCSTARASKPLQLQDLSQPSRENHLHLPPTSASETTSYFCRPAKVFMLFTQPGIIQSMSAMMPASEGWRLSEEKEGDTLDGDLESLVVSTFVLLKISSLKSDVDQLGKDAYISELRKLLQQIMPFTEEASKGTNVFIESSPFGSLSPSVFLNSLSKGIISNVYGFQKDIYLTDARCIMGAEGAPVYMTSDRKVNLSGMVISPFCWKQGEWLGLSLLASIRPLVTSLLHSLQRYSPVDEDEIETVSIKRELFPKTTVTKSWNLSKNMVHGGLANAAVDFRFEDIAKLLDNVVVGITCGGGWGSGIVINSSPGIILTCAHVIQPSRTGEVTIITSDGIHTPGQVLFHTHPSCFEKGDKSDSNIGISIWDLAVVTTKIYLPQAIPLATQLPPKGSSVVVAGHGIFSPNSLPSPTLVHGIISKIISIDVTSLSYSTPDDSNEKTVVIESNPFACDADVEDGARINSSNKSTIFVDTSSTEPSGYSSLQMSEKRNLASGSLLLGREENGLVPVMMQTTCTVYAGNSGGPVVHFHPKHGLQVVGVMICNTKDLANKATFPNINLAVPSVAISAIIREFISTGDKAVLKYLGVECSAASQLWALGFTPQSHL